MFTQIVTDLAAISVAAFGAALFCTQYLSFEVGRWLGLSRPSRNSPLESSSVVVGSMLGLVGFVLALTLSYASNRFDERRQGAIAEANAIGTAWLRADAIAHDKGREIAGQLREYAKMRLAFVEADAGAPNIPEVNQRTAVLQTEIWKNFKLVAGERNDPLVYGLMVALNDIFDRATGERFAFALPIPLQILWLVLILPVLAVAAVGFHLGRQADRQVVLPFVLIAMLTSVVTLVLDLASPRLRSIRASNIAHEWTISGLVNNAVRGQPLTGAPAGGAPNLPGQALKNR